MERTAATRQEIAQAQLLLEETFIRLKNGMGDPPNFSAKVNLKVRFSDVTLRIVAKGEECNPIVELTEQEDADDDFYRLIILKAYRDKMTYVRKGGENIVNIKVHEPSSSRSIST